MSIIVPGSGPIPSDLMAVGEAPGQDEARLLRPFVGVSGYELARYLSLSGLRLVEFYLHNVIPLYRPGNPDPTPELIAEWTPHLVCAIQTVRPKVIVAIGRFAVRWFLGDSADMESVHGIPHRGGEFDPSRSGRANGAIIIPAYHPAFGLHKSGESGGGSGGKGDAKALIAYDFNRAADTIRLVRGGRTDLIRFPHDPHVGNENYLDVTGTELAEAIRRDRPIHVGYDTEGEPSAPWSGQICWDPPTSYVLRCSQPDVDVGVRAIQELADSGCLFAVHDAATPRGTGYDTQVSRSFGLELRHANLSNTMYRAFALRLEPKGLKPLMYRWCGMQQEDYPTLIGGIGRTKQIAYLQKIAERDDWPRIPPQVRLENDGTLHLKKFGKLEGRVSRILTDIANQKRDKDGNLTDPRKRWLMLEPELRALAESELGLLPYGTLNDVPLTKAVYYAGRDAHGTLLLDRALTTENIRMGVEGVCWTGNRVLPIFEEMQHSGVPASKRAFVDLASTVRREMHAIQSDLSTSYFDGKPFNPAPNTKDVEALVTQLGITGLKKTKKSGRPSTSMKSLEYLAPKYPALAKIGEWRRRQKVLTTYCLPLIEVADSQISIESTALGGPNSDLFLVHGNYKPVTVETRRLAMEEPSLLNQPIRTDLGRKVRGCYMTTADHDDNTNPNTEVFAGWDFSSQEVRVTAHVTGDPLLCSIMRDPTRKIHMETASRVFGKPISDIDEINEKIPAKTAYFGMIYGLSGLGLLELFRSFGLDSWALDDCERLIEEIFRIYPGIKTSIARIRKEVLRTGIARDLYGHMRYLPSISSGSRGEAAEASRQAFSHVIQGTAQGMTQNAMVWARDPLRRLQEAGLWVRWCLQIHDEIILRIHRWLFPVVDAIMQQAMTQCYGGPTNVQLTVPVLVDAHMSTRWDRLK